MFQANAGNHAQDPTFQAELFFLQEMMKQALSKHRENIVQKQIAAGREFKVLVYDCLGSSFLLSAPGCSA